MAELIVRKLEDSVKRKLQDRARRHGLSMEEEARNILRNAVKDEGDDDRVGLGTRIAARFKGLDVPPIPRLKISMRIPKFDE